MILPPRATRSLTFAGVWGGHGLPSVSVEARFAPLAAVSLGVVLAAVTHAPRALPRGQPHTQLEVAALGVVVAATLWRGHEKERPSAFPDTVIMLSLPKPICQYSKHCNVRGVATWKPDFWVVNATPQ